MARMDGNGKWCPRLAPFGRSLRAFSLSMARHERTFGFAEGERKVSRMEAAGVDPD